MICLCNWCTKFWFRRGNRLPWMRFLLIFIRISECVFVASGIQHAICMHPIVICDLSGCIIFFPMSYKRHDFRKTLLNIKYVLWISLPPLTETFVILRINWRATIMNGHRSSCNVPVIVVRLQSNLNFLDIFSKNVQILKFMKIRRVKPSCSMRKDGQIWRS